MGHGAVPRAKHMGSTATRRSPRQHSRAGHAALGWSKPPPPVCPVDAAESSARDHTNFPVSKTDDRPRVILCGRGCFRMGEHQLHCMAQGRGTRPTEAGGDGVDNQPVALTPAAREAALRCELAGLVRARNQTNGRKGGRPTKYPGLDEAEPMLFRWLADLRLRGFRERKACRRMADDMIALAPGLFGLTSARDRSSAKKARAFAATLRARVQRRPRGKFGSRLVYLVTGT